MASDISQVRARVFDRLELQSELRSSLLASLATPQYAVDELGVEGVWHCLYRVPGGVGGIEQHTAPRTGCHAGAKTPYHDAYSVRRLLRHYMLAHARIHHAGVKQPIKEYMQSTDFDTIIVWHTSDYELYVAFSPLISRNVAYAACHKLLRKLKKEAPQLLIHAHATK